jgi:DNA-3-methyladenine glycosylase II
MNAYQMLRADAARMSAKAFSEAAENWRPYRGVAAHLLWAHFHAAKHA